MLGPLMLAAALLARGEAPQKVTVFAGSTAGYEGFRIPALVMTPKGTLLAFCAARKQLGDWGDIDIALRRSTDRGRTWEPMRIIADRGSMTVDNPVPIVDRKTGAIHFLFQVNYAQLYYMRSDDDGRTFSAPADITEVVHEFRRGWVNETSTTHYGWNVVAPGPVMGFSSTAADCCRRSGCRRITVTVLQRSPRSTAMTEAGHGGAVLCCREISSTRASTFRSNSPMGA
jgi:sialidase-1